MQIIIEVKGGMIQQVYADGPIYVDILDYDNLEADPSDDYTLDVQETLENALKSHDMEAYW